MLEPEHERLIQEDAIAGYVHSKRQDFIDGVIEQSSKIHVQSIEVDSVIDGLQTLYSEGYRNDEDDGEIVGFTHPEAAKNLYSDIDFVGGSGGSSIHGVQLEQSAELPNNSILLIHTRAIAPTLPSLQSFKPWCVKDPKGVLFIQTRG